MSHDEFKLKLEQELSLVVSELESIAVQDKISGDWIAIPDPEDLGNADLNVEADAVEEWNHRRGLMVQLETRYRNIKRALDKIEEGKYGLCEISGDPIEEERLLANPAARTNMANIDREKELTL